MSCLNKEKIYKSFDEIKPSNEQKDRMLENILAKAQKREEQKNKKVVNLADRKTAKVRQWVGIAAGLLLIAGIGTVWQTGVIFGPNVNTHQGIEGPSASPMGIRKIFNYEGYRYAFLNDGESFELKSEQLGEMLGKVPEGASFAEEGDLYALSDYDADFRMAVQWEDRYYIAQRVAKADESPMDIKVYFENMELEKNLVEVVISDQAEMEVLKTLSKEEAMIVAESFANTEVARLEDAQYEAIANAQGQGESYQVSFVLRDGSKVGHYVIPSMNYVTVGDYTCVSENLNEQIGSFFEDLITSKP